MSCELLSGIGTDTSGSASNSTLPNQLKTSTPNVELSNENFLLHQFVLDNSQPNESGSESYINCVLLSMPDTSVNDLNEKGYSALHLAVLKDNVLMVKKLLSCFKNIDINIRCDSGMFRYKNTALHFAAKSTHLLIIQELLDNGADVNARNRDGDTTLHFAAESGNLAIIKLLVVKGADVNLLGRSGMPLHCAVLSGHLQAVVFLIDQGASVNAKNGSGEIPLHHAAGIHHGHHGLDIVKLLLEKGSFVEAIDEAYNTPLHCAASSHNPDIVKLLLKEGIDVDTRCTNIHTPLQSAVISGDFNIVKLLLDEGADVNAGGESNCTPLILAARRVDGICGVFYTNIIKLLLKRGASVHICRRQWTTYLRERV